MIKINLLPLNLRKNESSIKIPAIPLICLAAAVLVVIHSLLFALIFYKRIQYNHLESTWKKMAPQFKEINGLKADLTLKKEKVKILEGVIRRDFYLTAMLDKINLAVPGGLWLNRLSVSERGLIFEGSVFSFNTDEVSLVNKFFNTLKSDELFVKNYDNFNLDSVQRRAIKQYEVFDFLLTAQSKSLAKAEEQEEAKSKAKPKAKAKPKTKAKK